MIATPREPRSYTGQMAARPCAAAPTLGMWSTGDLYLTEEAMTRSAERVQGTWRYERFGGSHWVPVDEPDRLNRLLIEFLS